MVLGLIIAGSIAGAVVGGAALGLGVAAASRIGSAYGRTVGEMYDEQRLVDYYNQQAYYQYASRGNHRYHQPSGYYSGGYYGYRR